MNKVYIIMGVSGAGKTTIGQLLAQRLNLPFYDADDFHPPVNIAKMKNGIPLEDEDRFPWLHELADQVKIWSQKKGAVLACSALKESYRSILKDDVVEFVILNGDYHTILERMQQRNHFMAPHMLQSQFETLEIPEYGIHVSIVQEPEAIVAEIMNHIAAHELSDVGVYGIGVMGKSLALNMLDKGFKVSVCNRKEEALVSKFLEEHPHDNVRGFTHLEDFVTALKKPRKILLMVKAGEAVDLVLDQLSPLLSADDIVIDGGNSFYKDTERRMNTLSAQGVYYIGAGVSGGEKGARFGPSIMPGGDKKAYNDIRHIFESIAARDSNGNPCCSYIGEGGSGHFVKMIHNGIEYAEMQLLAEVYVILKRQLSHEEIITTLEKWQNTAQASFLLEATIKVLKKKENDGYVIDTILDKAGNKGTGAWSSIEAFRLGVSSSMMSAAVMARFNSSQKEQRLSYAKRISQLTSPSSVIGVDTLFLAYSIARIINHHQGFEIINAASKAFQWQLNLSEIARIWTNGCIINSKYMESCVQLLHQNDALLDDASTFDFVSTQIEALKNTLHFSIAGSVDIPCFMAAYQYFCAMTTSRSSANIIQAQRDYFGAHTYQKIDDPSGKFYHTNWETHD